MCRLVGYKRFKSKKGKNFCVANIVSGYSNRDIERNCVGEKVEEIFLPDEQYDLLTPDDIGRELSFDYDMSGGRAYLIGVTVK